MDRAEFSRADAESPYEARFTTGQYYRIADSGALDGYAKTELHEGRIVVVNAQYVPHGRFKTRLGRLLDDIVEASFPALEVFIETDVEIEDGEVLQPDVSIVQRNDAEKALPAALVRLVVEVAASTEETDLGRKRLRYAAALIPEYWVALLAARRFERFAEPVGGDYARRDSFAFGEGLPSLTLSGLALPAGWPAR